MTLRARGRKPREWGAVVLVVPDARADDVLGWVAGDALGVEQSDAAAGRRRLVIYTEDRERAERLARRAADRYRANGAGELRADVRTVADEPWVERYQAALRPFPFGEHFVVCPSGAAETRGDRLPILLVPGRAFGTGEHATTRLCAAALEKHVAAGQRWVDVGCGSGILSVVASRRGAGMVLALDIDPDAVEVAREVLEANRIGSEVEVVCGSARVLASATWDGAVANIEPGYFDREATVLAGALRADGTLITSGYLDEHVERLRRVFEAAGLSEVEIAREGEWVAMVHVRSR